MDSVVARGRWQCPRTAETYVDEGSMQLTWTRAQRARVKQGRSLCSKYGFASTEAEVDPSEGWEFNFSCFLKWVVVTLESSVISLREGLIQFHAHCTSQRL